MSPYEILNVRKNASGKSVQKSYRKLAMEHHPDRGGDPERFAKIQLAFDVLSDDKRRKRFDQTGDWGQSYEPSEFQIVGQILAHVLRAVVEGIVKGNGDVEKEDLAEHCRKQLRKGQIEIRQKERDIMVLIANWKKTLDRWTVEKDEHDMIRGIIGANIDGMEKQLHATQTEGEHVAKALKFLEGAKYRVDAAMRTMRVSMMMGFGSATTATAGSWSIE